MASNETGGKNSPKDDGRKTPPGSSVVIKKEKTSPTHSVRSSHSKSSTKGEKVHSRDKKDPSKSDNKSDGKKHDKKSDRKGGAAAGTSGASKRGGASDGLPVLKHVKVDKTSFATGSLAERMRKASGVGETEKSAQRIIRRACVPQPTGKNRNPW